MKFRTFEYLGEGRHRIVFRCSKKYVVKIPLNEQGIFDNWNEARQAKINGWLEKNQKAKCRLLDTILVMEYVVPYYVSDGAMPKWAYYVDCGQVGLTQKGELVAFDFA